MSYLVFTLLFSATQIQRCSPKMLELTFFYQETLQIRNTIP
jgi:hypothetical protein